jgi:phospholipid-translocating ATPase
MTDIAGPVEVPEKDGPAQSNRKRLKRYSKAAMNWLNGLPTGRHEIEFEPEQATIPNSTRNNLEDASNRSMHIKENWVKRLVKWKKAKIIQLSPKALEGIKTRGLSIPPVDDIRRNGGNTIKTSKYTMMNFLPKNLYSQFHRVANFYFLFLIILQCIPAISNWNPFFAAIPLTIICGVTALKDAIEDWKRHQSDNKVNYSIVKCLKRSQSLHTPTKKPTKWEQIGHNLILFKKWLQWKLLFIPTNPPENPQDIIVGEARWKLRFWKDLMIGDIVFLENNENIPADVLVLSSSESQGVCFVETKNLDGETNLKLKKGLKETINILSAGDAEELEADVEYSIPCSDLNSFQGVAKMKMKSGTEESPIDSENLILSGSVLRNTSFIIGIVMYTGLETKLSLNTGQPPIKRSRIERQMNPQIILSFGLLFVICLACAIVQGNLVTNVIIKAPYWITPEFGNRIYSSGLFTGFLTFWSSLILFQTLIPLSLYITVEIIKIIQAYLIHSDMSIFWEEENKPCVPRAWNLSDDLGQIEYIFSDKTGTLTMNVMEFKSCSINGVKYGNIIVRDIEELKMKESLSSLLPYKYVPPKKLSFVDSKLTKHFSESNQEAINFFRIMAITHSVLIDNANNLDKDDFKPHLIEYKAQSPDEAALVNSTRNLGFVFLGICDNIIRVNILGSFEEFKLLETIEFKSSRKRMSIIVQNPLNNQIQLFCKGADNVIYERIIDGRLNEGTMDHLNEFAIAGLRTLCFARRNISKEYWTQWSLQYQEAKKKIGEERSLIMGALEDEIEQEMELLGATAIEDRLQEGVPECIETLKIAGIKIWVLTGDKLETAINIGFSCKLLTKDMKIFTLKGPIGIEDLNACRDDIEKGSGKHKFGLVVDGTALKEALQKHHREVFLKIACECSAIICCRTSPLQKAKVVELVKKTKNAMTLAIGDGANDVNMIQMADIGIGISTGREGMQAVMASDYAIGQFRFLKDLLLVHGRWSYQRIAEATLQSFHKNIAFVAVSFWYQFYCAFTSQYVYDYTYAILFNILLTFLPVFAVGCFDRDLERKSALAVPEAYQRGIKQQAYSIKIYSFYVLNAVWQGATCFFIPRLAYLDVPIDNWGHPESLMLLGNASGLAIILAVILFVLQNTYAWSVPVIAAQAISILILFAVLLAGSFSDGASLYGAWAIFLIPRSYLCVVISLVVALFPQIILRYVRAQWFPSDLDILRELQNMKQIERASCLKKRGNCLNPIRISSNHPEKGTKVGG